MEVVIKAGQTDYKIKGKYEVISSIILAEGLLYVDSVHVDVYHRQGETLLNIPKMPFDLAIKLRPITIGNQILTKIKSIFFKK